MKRALILLLIVSLSIITCAAALGEAASAPMSAEELLQAGKDAEAAEDYRKSAELGEKDAVEYLKELVEAGHVSGDYLEGLGE